MIAAADEAHLLALGGLCRGQARRPRLGPGLDLRLALRAGTSTARGSRTAPTRACRTGPWPGRRRARRAPFRPGARSARSGRLRSAPRRSGPPPPTIAAEPKRAVAAHARIRRSAGGVGRHEVVDHRMAELVAEVDREMRHPEPMTRVARRPHGLRESSTPARREAPRDRPRAAASRRPGSTRRRSPSSARRPSRRRRSWRRRCGPGRPPDGRSATAAARAECRASIARSVHARAASGASMRSSRSRRPSRAASSRSRPSASRQASSAAAVACGQANVRWRAAATRPASIRIADPDGVAARRVPGGAVVGARARVAGPGVREREVDTSRGVHRRRRLRQDSVPM